MSHLACILERMCERLAEIHEAMSHLAERFDPDLISAPVAARVVEEAASIEKMASTVKALAATRVAETELWRRQGDRSPAHHLARKTGSTVGQAAQALETGRRLQALPETAAAAKRGELSVQQASAIAEAASVDPTAENRLLDNARRSSLQELKDECARTKAAALPDPEARRRRIHAGRYLRSYTDGEGAFNLHMRDNPEVGAELMAAIQGVRDRLFRKAKVEGRPDSLEACAADALMELVRAGTEPAHPGNRTSGTKILVRVDLESWLRGYPVDGETAEIVGFGPVAVSAVREMMESGDPFLAAVVTKGVDVVGVAHLGRRPTAHQQSALEWLYPSCAAVGCSAVAGLELDHRLDWSKSHITLVALLDRLCSHHHALKTLDGWALVQGKGKRAFVPPDDPRHPRHSAEQRPPPPAGNGPPPAAPDLLAAS